MGQTNHIKEYQRRAVRTKGKEAKELADMYFFETLVRLHRAGEGGHIATIGLREAWREDYLSYIIKRKIII